MKDILEEGEVYKVKGYIKVANDEPPVVIANTIEPIAATLTNRIILTAESQADINLFMEELGRLHSDNGDPVYIDFRNMRILTNREKWVNAGIFQHYSTFALRDKSKILQW
jgi:hypothetical protein